MIIEVYYVMVQNGPVLWLGNITHPYPFRYVYTYKEPT